MALYGGFCRKLITGQGFPLAVGGLCPAGDETLWEHKCELLTNLEIEDTALFDVDYLLAAALRDLFDSTVPVAGASICVYEEGNGATGGVLGNPHAPICSATDEEEELPGGFCLFTRPGGPGLAVSLDVRETDRLWNDLCSTGDPEDPETVFRQLRRCGATYAVVVYDGSGTSGGGVFVWADGRPTCAVIEGMKEEKSGGEVGTEKNWDLRGHV